MVRGFTKRGQLTRRTLALLAVGAIFLIEIGCATVRTTAIDYQAHQVTVCGDGTADQMYSEATRVCRSAATLLRCGVTPSGAVFVPVGYGGFFAVPNQEICCGYGCEQPIATPAPSP